MNVIWNFFLGEKCKYDIIIKYSINIYWDKKMGEKLSE